MSKWTIEKARLQAKRVHMGQNAQDIDALRWAIERIEELEAECAEHIVEGGKVIRRAEAAEVLVQKLKKEVQDLKRRQSGLKVRRIKPRPGVFPYVDTEENDND